jgi:hypothetical protein
LFSPPRPGGRRGEAVLDSAGREAQPVHGWMRTDLGDANTI